ncbi:MAG: TrkH family potassium uptake protein [Methanocellales archaeon]|nr:TrkH family potassium uptake protein [Methanocellales archaeon]
MSEDRMIDGDLGTVVHYIGLMLQLFAILVAIPILVALYFKDELSVLLSFATVAILSFVIGYILRRCTLPEELNIRNAMVISALTWLTLSAFSAIPFILSGILPPLDAMYESMAGLTTTGHTMFVDFEDIPYSIFFWRSLMQWVGGAGIILLFIAILVHGVGGTARRLYTAEARVDRIEPSIIHTSRWIWRFYLAFTIVAIAIFSIAGMPLWDAINHGMTGISTGGFTVVAGSISAYDSIAVEMAVSLIMIAGAISFVLHKKWVDRNFHDFLRNPEIKLMASLILILTILLTVELGGNIRLASFNVISALTGTGFSNTCLVEWSELSKLLLIIPMTIGGGYGSAAAALKLIRCVIFLKSIGWLVKKYLLPQSAVVPLKIDGTVIKDDEIMMVGLYILVYLFVMLIGTWIFVMHGHPMINSLFDVASALGNVGLTVGVIGPDMSIVEKITMIIIMWMGRLEIFPVLLLLTNIIKRP